MSEQKQSNGKPDHLLALRGFTKSFGPVQALSDVDFEVDGGEVVALVGDNGAGKSTLIKAMDGVQPPDSGQAYFEGEPVRIADPNSATKLGIATVFQDLALCDNLDVVANLYLGQEVTCTEHDGRIYLAVRRTAQRIARPVRWLFDRIRALFDRLGSLLQRIRGLRWLGRRIPTWHPVQRIGRIGAINETEMEQRTSELLDELSVTTLGSVRTEVGSLSGGQRQSVAIARSLLGEPKVVLLDEPTAALGVAQTAQVLNLVKRLRDRGLGVVVISHNLEDIFQVADRIVVLRLGRREATFDVKKTTREEVVAAITGASAELKVNKEDQ